MLKALLKKYEHLFDGTLGVWNDEPYNIELKEGAKPYHSRPFPVPKANTRTNFKTRTQTTMRGRSS